MLRVYSCITGEHDLRLVLVAGLICLLSAFTAFSIFERTRRAARHQAAWVALAGFVAGTGIWATHFIAMLAFDPHIPVGYDLGLTLLSIAIAIAITGIGWGIALKNGRWSTPLGGAFIGAGIGSMHYAGMAAVKLPGRLTWDMDLVATSLVLGIGLSVWALAEHRRKPEAIPVRPALLFTLAICGLHFTAMAAATAVVDGRYSVPASAIDSRWLTFAVAGMAVVILAIGLLMVVFDRKLAHNAKEEEQRLRIFADAAIEGLVVIDGEEILDVNLSFISLAGYTQASLPKRLGELLPEVNLAKVGMGDHAAPTECRLTRGDGTTSDVEILLRPLVWKGKDLSIIAVRDISERKEAAERIAHLAYHDLLTGLPNRGVFAEHLSRTIDGLTGLGDEVAILCLDLDGFKAVNDVYGHPMGDELLASVAQRLRSVVRGNELVARLGGDEFAIIQAGGAQPAHAGLLADRILEAIAEPFDLPPETLRISCSIGVAIGPDDGVTPDELIKNADMALYRAKAEGRGIARFYEVAMDEALRHRRQLEADLRQAIPRGELCVHFQPIADLESGRILGFEALLRWNHPTMGLIGPSTFIPIAEDSSLILKLGEWVLREACREAASWTPPLKLSVNLSPVQFAYDDLAGQVEQILAETGLDPTRLELEVTEGLLIKDPESAVAILKHIKALGVQISLDDFGTGYSSLSYFRMFPFDKVKIDQSFIQDMVDNPQAQTIISSVIGLGHGLGMPVVAEGVETEAQLELLRKKGCDQIQGYLVSRPNAIDHFRGVVLEGQEVALPQRKTGRTAAG